METLTKHLRGLSLKSPKKASGYFVACCRKTVPLYQPQSNSLYTPVNVLRGNVKTILMDKNASQTLLKRRTVNSPIVRSAKKRRVSSVPRTN